MSKYYVTKQMISNYNNISDEDLFTFCEILQRKTNEYKECFEIIPVKNPDGDQKFPDNVWNDALYDYYNGENS